VNFKERVVHFIFLPQKTLLFCQEQKLEDVELQAEFFFENFMIISIFYLSLFSRINKQVQLLNFKENKFLIKQKICSTPIIFFPQIQRLKFAYFSSLNLAYESTK